MQMQVSIYKEHKLKRKSKGFTDNAYKECETDHEEGLPQSLGIEVELRLSEFRKPSAWIWWQTSPRTHLLQGKSSIRPCAYEE